MRSLFYWYRRDSGPYQTERTPDTEYTIDTSSFPAGEYEVSVAVVLGDQRSAPTGEGEPMTGTATISVSGKQLFLCVWHGSMHIS